MQLVPFRCHRDVTSLCAFHQVLEDDPRLPSRGLHYASFIVQNILDSLTGYANILGDLIYR